MRWLVIGMMAFLAGSCKSLTTVTIDPLPAQAQRRQLIEGEGTRWSILLIPVASTDFVQETKQALMGQCRGGRVEGVMTKMDQTSYVLASVTTVTMRGFCVRS